MKKQSVCIISMMNSETVTLGYVNYQIKILRFQFFDETHFGGKKGVFNVFRQFLTLNILNIILYPLNKIILLIDSSTKLKKK